MIGRPATLTIAIPTFNRPADLFRTVGSLVDQLDQNTRLLVIDNCSEQAADIVLKPFLLEHAGAIRVVRNRLNIGGTANILRCIELSDTPYVWLLGDDDLPVAGSVETIHRHVQNDPSCAFWKFSSAQHPFEGQRRVSAPDQFLTLVGPLQQAIWISNGVFNRSLIAPWFAIACHWTSSAAAHLLLVLLSLQDGNYAVISADTIVEIKPPAEDQKWDLAAIFAGFPLLLEAPLDWSTKQVLGRLIGEMFGAPESLALRTMQTANEVWCHGEKLYHYRNLGNAIYRSFAGKSRRLRYSVLEKSLRAVAIIGAIDRKFTHGRLLGRPALSRQREARF